MLLNGQTRTFRYQEGVGNVCRVVDAEADDEDDADAHDGVDGQAPEVDEANHVDEGQDDAGEHENAELDRGQHEHGDDEHGGDGEAQVPPKLAAHDVVALPRRIDLKVHK